MGLIREPKNVDFYVDQKPLTKKEMDEIHQAIAYYNTTGKIIFDRDRKNFKKINSKRTRSLAK